MNAKITLPDLITALSENSGQPRSVCERFIKVMFATVAETLVAGENVKIKGLGTFKVSDVEERKSVNVNTGAEMIIPGHRKVSFNPDKSLAELINLPFALFEPVELEDEVSEEMLAGVDEQMPEAAQVAETQPPVQEEAPAPEPSAPETAEPTEGSEPDPWEEAVEEQFSEPVSTNEPEPAPEPTPEPEPAETSQEPEEETIIEESRQAPAEAPAKPATASSRYESIIDIEDEAEENRKKVEIHVHSPECHAPHFRKGIYIGIAAAVVCMVLLLAAWRIFLQASFCALTATAEPQSQGELIAQQAREATPAADTLPPAADTLPQGERIEPVQAAEAPDAAPTQASDKATEEHVQEAPAKVYDTITKKRFLTTMAKEHYGDYNLWPYIYDENKAILGHPDRIKPGTKVVIPPASKYGIDAGNPDCIARAKRRGAEIYAKYKK